jgi:hypothetical protein
MEIPEKTYRIQLSFSVGDNIRLFQKHQYGVFFLYPLADQVIGDAMFDAVVFDHYFAILKGDID